MKNKILIIMICLGFTISCATDPYSGESKVSKTAWGTGIGALAGAGVGALIGGEKGALIGAGIGAAGGAGAGAYMDVQARKLRQELQGTGVMVQRDGENIKLIMPGNITFNTDSSTIKPQFNGVIDSIGKVVKEYNKTLVKVTGYTDSTGSSSYNMSLSQRRAASVANRLELRGVVSNRLIVSGMGSNNPIASNATVVGRAQNRRVEIMLVNQQK